MLTIVCCEAQYVGTVYREGCRSIDRGGIHEGCGAWARDLSPGSGEWLYLAIVCHCAIEYCGVRHGDRKVRTCAHGGRVVDRVNRDGHIISYNMLTVVCGQPQDINTIDAECGGGVDCRSISKGCRARTGDLSPGGSEGLDLAIICHGAVEDRSVGHRHSKVGTSADSWWVVDRINRDRHVVCYDMFAVVCCQAEYVDTIY